jgi:hypothetical protein
MIIKRWYAGLERNSQGCGGKAICSLSILSSIIPEILTYPPRATNYHTLYHRQFSFFREYLTSKQIEFSTLVLNNLAGIKCPNSSEVLLVMTH